MLNPAFASYETILTIGSNRDLYLVGGVLTFYSGQDFAFGPALPANTWTHVAITYDGAVLRAFVNGIQRGTDQAVALATVTAPLQVGAWINGTQNTDYWSGTLDEVRVYGRALTATELLADMVSAGRLTSPTRGVGAVRQSRSMRRTGTPGRHTSMSRRSPASVSLVTTTSSMSARKS